MALSQSTIIFTPTPLPSVPLTRSRARRQDGFDDIGEVIRDDSVACRLPPIPASILEVPSR